MKIPDRSAVQDPASGTQDGIAKVFVQWRHCLGRDAPFEAVAHHQLVAFAQGGDKIVQSAEVVTVITVAHDDVAATGLLDATLQRGAVATGGDRHHAGPQTFGELLRSVGAAVVGN